jgi:hypothetical protein
MRKHRRAHHRECADCKTHPRVCGAINSLNADIAKHLVKSAQLVKVLGRNAL